MYSGFGVSLSAARRRLGTASASATPGPEGDRMTELDVYLFREGTHARLYRLLGCHLVGTTADGGASARF
jgi:hypothetical protein